MDQTYGSNTLTAFYENRANAEAAVARLTTLGISESSIRTIGGDATVSGVDDSGKGFWEMLGDFFMPDEDRATYTEGLRRGGYLVTVSGFGGDRYNEVLDILDDEGSVDVDERAESWRSEGWTGAGFSGNEGSGFSTPGASRSATGIGRSAFGSATTGTSIRGDEEVIPVVEEELRVGKRDVNLGRVRVRSYVVEEPVSEQVNLRSERVHVERRPVDRPVEAGDRLFSDKVLEAEEHIEEAVISKTARVTEEISLRREADERSETVSDTVRHTEVEVEDERDATIDPGRRRV